MAFTATLLKKSVHGDERVEHYLVTADANSGSVSTGVGVITLAHLSVKSAATGAQKVKANLSAASAAANGSLFLSSCTSGDDFYVTVYGRS